MQGYTPAVRHELLVGNGSSTTGPGVQGNSIDYTFSGSFVVPGTGETCVMVVRTIGTISNGTTSENHSGTITCGNPVHRRGTLSGFFNAT